MPWFREEAQGDQLGAWRSWLMAMSGLLIVASLALRATLKTPPEFNHLPTRNAYLRAYSGMVLVTTLLLMVLLSSKWCCGTTARIVVLVLLASFDLALIDFAIELAWY